MADLAHNSMSFFKRQLTCFDRYWIYSASEATEGMHTAHDSEDFIIYGVLQPAYEAILNVLPEGQRNNIAYVLHTANKLKINELDNGNTLNTYVRLNDIEYKVIQFSNYSNWSFWEYGLTNTSSDQGR